MQYKGLVCGLAAVLCALACTPRPNGVCQGDTQCRGDEACYQSICIKRAFLPDAGVSTGIDVGGCIGPGCTASSLTVVAPAANAYVNGSLTVIGSAESPSPVKDVTFSLRFSKTGADIGAVSVAAPNAGPGGFLGNLAVTDPAANGPAELAAVMHRTGAPDLPAQSMNVVLDQVAPVIAPDPANSAYSSWHSVPLGTATFAPTVAISDDGSGVSSAAGSEPDIAAPGGPVLARASRSAGSAANGIWAFGLITLPGDPAIESDAFVMTVTARDLAGNVGNSGSAIRFKLDNRPPAFGATDPQLDPTTQPDAVDSAGRRWFKGAALFPAGTAPDVVLRGTVSEKFFVSSAAQLPGAVRSGICSASTAAGLFACQTTVARPGATYGVGKPYTVTFTAKDQAGNVGSKSIDLYFDNLSPATVTIDSDPVWHARSGNVAVTAHLPALPASGLASTNPVVLLPSGASCSGAIAPDTIADNGAGGRDMTFSLPASCAPAGVEGAYPFRIQVTSLVGATSTATGSRFIDDAPPTVDASAPPPYPAAQAGPFGWSRDGQRFQVRDQGTLYSFAVWDCGAGLDTAAAVPFSVAGNPSTRSVSIAAAGTKACANGVAATLYQVAVQADLKTAAPWAFSALDNTASVAVTVKDALGHSASGLASVSVTRRLWQSAAIGASSVAVGPGAAFVASAQGVYRMDAATGAPAQLSSLSPSFGPAVAANGGSPFVFWADAGVANSGNIYAVAPSAGSTPSICAPTTGQDSNTITGFMLVGGTTLRATSRWSTTNVVCSCRPACDCVANPGCEVCTNKTVSGNSTLTFTPAPPASCAETTGANFSGSPVVGRGVFYWLRAGSLTATPLGGGASSFAVVPGTPTSLIATDNGTGNDAVLVSSDALYRYDYAGSLSAASTIAGIGPPVVSSVLGAPAQLVGLSAAGFADVDLGGTARGGFPVAAPKLALVDASTPPIAYLAATGSVSAVQLSASAGLSGGGLRMSLVSPAWTAAPSDLTLSAAGTLFLVVGGQVFAMQTDSPGLGTWTNGPNQNAWPAPGRDACKSNSLGSACPY